MAIIKQINRQEALDFLMPRHYAGRKPQITKAYGWFIDDKIKAVCTFGKPASNPLCIGVCGKEHSSHVYELNRLCRTDDFKAPLSKFVGHCLREVSKLNWIIISYADTEMNHTGYIYQATNFLYTGATKSRTDKYTKGNKHSRHYDKDAMSKLRKVRSSKHRYVYFATKDRKLKRTWEKELNYSIKPYPKTENKNYILGHFLKPNIIKSN